jgi:hypothetical protein
VGVGGWAYGAGVVAAAVGVPWYGGLLGWSSAGEGEWSARHAGRVYRMLWLGRESTSGHPGWYLAEHPDEPGGGHLGPPLGRQFPAARALAEVYAITDPEDRISYPGVPSLVTVMSGGGALLPTPAGRMLLAWPDPATARITLYGDSPPGSGLFTPGPHMATITPVLGVPARPAAEPVTVTWQPAIGDGAELAAEATWRAAARHVAQAVG